MTGFINSFNPRTYIRYDGFQILFSTAKIRFNPRTYIRYDKKWAEAYAHVCVSIHVPI